VAPAPCLERGYITFGSFNSPNKIGREVVKLWAEVLRNVPGSRILFKYWSMDTEVMRDRYQGWLSKEGISRERVQFEGSSPAKEYLATYSEIDIALDPTPYNGTTTTFEALFMGVPVLTLKGHWHASRVGASILTNLGFDTLVASTPEHLLLLASSLSNNREDLIHLRAVLRNLLLKSPLCDAVAFTQSFETALIAAYSTRRAA